jgi:hypothetical protein
VSERVLGSSNPVARWGRKSKRSCFDSIGGFVAGIVLFFVTFLIPFNAARTEKDSKDVRKLEVISAEQASGWDGKALVEGVLTVSNSPRAPFGNSSGIVAYRYLVEDYETKIVTKVETHTETRNGQDVEVKEEVKKEVSDWVTKRDDKVWADLQLGAVNIEPGAVDIRLGWEEIYKSENPPGKHRETVEVIRPPLKVLLAAELAGGQIAAQPDFAILTWQSKDELVASLNQAEEGRRWGLIFLSILLWTISLNLLMGPAMLLLNIMPVEAVGCAARAAVTFVAFLIACSMTFIVYFLTAYWWLVFILLAVLAVVAFSLGNKHRKPQMAEEVPTAEE